MKAGKYYIGDLCYLLTDEYYKEIVCSFEHVSEEKIVKGVGFWWHFTAYGDGCYQDQFEKDYDVDAGLIGCVNLDTIPEDALRKDDCWKRGGNIHTFEEDFSCKYEREYGTIVIGNILIETDPEEQIEYCERCGEEVDYCVCDEFCDDDSEDDSYGCLDD